MSEDWVRIEMAKDCARLIGDLETEKFDAFEISGRKWRKTPFKSYTNSGYPELDICNSPPEGKFDIIFAEQVWEHLSYPYKAARHVLEALHPGGYFLITVPFLIRRHPTPLDCTRWTAEGLKYFLEEVGFDPQYTYSNDWGNRACLNENLDKWVEYVEGEHSLENEDWYPVTTWALGRKSL